MKYRMVWILACLVVTFSLQAVYVNAQTSVWALKGPNATVYLAGASHVLRASDHPLPKAFDRAYHDSARIIFETSLADMETPEFIMKLTAMAGLTDGTTLRDHLSPQAYAKAAAFCKERGYPFEDYQRFQPWMLSMFLTMQELARLGVTPEHGVDQFYYRKALKDQKPVGGLETIDEQLGFLAKFGGSMGSDQLMETIDDLNRLPEKLTDIVTAWRKGDEKGIEAFNLRELKAYPELYATLIVDRNNKWIEKIEPLIRGRQNIMIIVGVGHLGGKDSVIEGLRQRGHTITQLNH